MTIPEAVQLVIRAADLGGAGDVFVLEMGEPVRIVDLARNMIRLSGKEPETDIAIEFIGPKPGEKLHEELWNQGEKVSPTSHPKLLRATRKPIDQGWLGEELAELEGMVERGETLDVVSKLSALMREPHRVDSAVLEDTLH
jgi:FlaA1/EpsC-like NDP-sugar epimerase